jgi:hypothetical protein
MKRINATKLLITNLNYKSDIKTDESPIIRKFHVIQFAKLDFIYS